MPTALVPRNLDIRDRVMLLAPCEDSITLFPVGFLTGTSEESFARRVFWAQELHELVARSRVRRAAPIHRAPAGNSTVAAAAHQLRAALDEDPGLIRRMTGGEFERFVRHIFESCGIAVQANVRVLGAEIDLLLLHCDGEQGVEFSIVECKHRDRSGKKVEVSEVVRLFGLSEALESVVPLRNRILVSTAGFTRSALDFASVYELRLADYQQVMVWAEQNRHEAVDELPIFRFVTVARDGRLRLDETLRAYVQSPDSIMVIGAIDRMELWNREKFELLTATPLEPWEIKAIQSQIFG